MNSTIGLTNEIVVVVHFIFENFSFIVFYNFNNYFCQTLLSLTTNLNCNCQQLRPCLVVYGKSYFLGSYFFHIFEIPRKCKIVFGWYWEVELPMENSTYLGGPS